MMRMPVTATREEQDTDECEAIEGGLVALSRDRTRLTNAGRCGGREIPGLAAALIRARCPRRYRIGSTPGPVLAEAVRTAVSSRIGHR